MVDVLGFIGEAIAPLIVDNTAVPSLLKATNVLFEITPAARARSAAMNEYDCTEFFACSGVVRIVDLEARPVSMCWDAALFAGIR